MTANDWTNRKGLRGFVSSRDQKKIDTQSALFPLFCSFKSLICVKCCATLSCILLALILCVSLINYLTISIHHAIGGAQLHSRRALTQPEKCCSSPSARDNVDIPFYFCVLCMIRSRTCTPLLLSGYQLSGALCHYNKQTIYPPKLFISRRAPQL
jgi:hypothetical protein